MFAGLLSCSEEITPSPYTYTKVFTGEQFKTWKFKFIEQTFNDDIEDTFTEPCALDDELVFYANAERAFKAINGNKKCASNETFEINDTWTFNNASATLTMILPIFNVMFGLDPNLSLPFIVRDARESKLELEFFLDQENTVSYRIHFEATDED